MSKTTAQLDAEIAEALEKPPHVPRARQLRAVASAAEALRASETAKRTSDDAHLASDHREASEAHRRAARIHKSSGPPGAEAAWLHELAVINHRQAAKARGSKVLAVPDPTRTKRAFAAFQEKLAAANEHEYMATEYARQALAAARKR